MTVNLEKRKKALLKLLQKLSQAIFWMTTKRLSADEKKVI